MKIFGDVHAVACVICAYSELLWTSSAKASSMLVLLIPLASML